MPYKTIAVYLPTPETVSDIMTVALPFAELFGAHLNGLHVHSGIPVAATAGAHIPAEIIEHYMETLREDAKAVEKAFSEAAAKTSISTEWVGEEDKSTDAGFLATISALTRCCDLVVLGQPDTRTWDGDLTADIILSAGRPALIVPAHAKPIDPEAKVVVGWDGTREAARAVFDALPLLRRASKVFVVTVGKSDDIKQAVQHGGVALSASLARHDVKAEVATIAKGDASAGEALTSYASNQNAGLLVMGCYGHSRLREHLFGGATLYALKNMKVPVLMSH